MNRSPLLAMLMKAAFACFVIALAPPAAQSAASVAPVPGPDTLVSPSSEEPPPAILDDAALQELVAPVALYPDDLLGVVLPASTYPLQVVQAARFLEALEKDPSLKPDEAWDDAIVALLNYPEVVQMMDEDLDWTWRLGEAVLNQEEAVLAAVTAFREQAVAAGNLKTDDKQIVEVKDEVVEIRPANPQEIYVPYYEPARVIVYQPAPVYYYYPRPRPVYYYPYPADYYYPYGYFWGLSSAFWIGWSSYHVHVYHHYHYRHPYYGYTYYSHPHYYDRPYRPYRYSYAHHYDYSQHHDSYRTRDGYRSGDRRYDDSPYHWRPDRRHGARPQPRSEWLRTRQRDGSEYRQQQNDGRRWLVDNKSASPLGRLDRNPFTRQRQSATDGDRSGLHERTTGGTRADRRFANEPTLAQADRAVRRSPAMGESNADRDRRRPTRDQIVAGLRSRASSDAVPIRGQRSAASRAGKGSQSLPQQRREPTVRREQRSDNGARLIASGRSADGRQRSARVDTGSQNATRQPTATDARVRTPTYVRPQRPAVAYVPPNSSNRAQHSESRAQAAPRASAPRQAMGFAPPARVERGQVERGRVEARPQAAPRVAPAPRSAPPQRVERQARAEARAAEPPRQAQREQAPRERQSKRSEQRSGRGFGGRQHF